MEAEASLRFTVDTGIATIAINRPERRNAIDTRTADLLYNCWETIDCDEAIRVAILTSSDCGTFSAGMDLKEAAEIRRERDVDILSVIRDPFMERMRALRKPLIAAMTGHFAGGGFLLALNCDLRIGAAGTSGGITEVQRGRGSPWAVPLLWTLPQAIFMEMALAGDMVSIERLHHFGFINYVEPTPEAVRSRAAGLAGRIRDNAPLSVGAAKASILAASELGSTRGLEEAKRLHEPVYASEDAKEGPRAFAEKRKPRWAGR